MKAYLALATGDIFPGRMFNGSGDISGEVVLYQAKKFNHHILTDPVNYGRIIVSDSSIIENRGPLFTEIESYLPHLKALIIIGKLVKSPLAETYLSLESYLDSNEIALFKPKNPASLIETLEKTGMITGTLTTHLEPSRKLHLKRAPELDDSTSHRPSPRPDIDPVRRLSTSLDYFWDLTDEDYPSRGHREYVVVAYDFGPPYSMLRNLKRLDCDIRIVPADFSPEQVIALNPEGILLGGGPGYPDQMSYAISNISRLIGLRPILATGLGHILLGLSFGARMEILNRPHFGDEIEVEQVDKGDFKKTANRFITVQSHNVCLNRKSLEKAGFKITLINPCDNSVEGYENEDYLIQSYAFPLIGESEFISACLSGFVNCMESHRAGTKAI